MFKSIGKRRDEKDEELLQRYMNAGDRFALGLLFRRYGKQIYGVCHYYLRQRENSEDAAMELCELITVQLKKQPKIKSFKDWLFIICRNYCFKKMQANQRFQALWEDWEDFPEEKYVQIPDTDTLYNKRETFFDVLDQEMKKLSDLQQHCLTAFYWQGQRYKQIADNLDMSIDEVRSAMQNGRRNLRNRFKAFKAE